MSIHEELNGYNPLKHWMSTVLKIEHEKGYLEGYKRGESERDSLKMQLEEYETMLSEMREKLMGEGLFI
ncbi:hypothetical protein [Acidaminobacter hydrogenoformans]|uniref:Uncharacterized protein n=1 Tax=Acidaminobacter hydrogenoformans DSM 2784 TaxID=1120920 RepID=A0A1G5S6W0_9FIRM|nr:hypothetical protein [Acidaminobacter hydrogenoformans]SCZ82095.1 hypothetical protein SAMN03080599_03352 [Acidaminobacter hydrogenoformans DSM 2784]